MDPTYTSRQTANAANISRLRLDQWIARGYVVPEIDRTPGEARRYTFRQVMEIATLAEIARLGIDPKAAVRWSSNLLLFKDDAAVLVIWQGPAELIPTSPRGAPVPERSQHSGNFWYDPDHPAKQYDIVRLSDLPAFIDDRNKRSIILVNLNHLEDRVIKALAEAPAE